MYGCYRRLEVVGRLQFVDAVQGYPIWKAAPTGGVPQLPRLEGEPRTVRALASRVGLARGVVPVVVVPAAAAPLVAFARGDGRVGLRIGSPHVVVGDIGPVAIGADP